jgi:hypothetical protein
LFPFLSPVSEARFRSSIYSLVARREKSLQGSALFSVKFAHLMEVDESRIDGMAGLGTLMKSGAQAGEAGQAVELLLGRFASTLEPDTLAKGATRRCNDM